MKGEQGRYRKECQGQSLPDGECFTGAAAPVTTRGILVGINTDDQRCLPPTIISSFTGARGKNILCLYPPGTHLPPLAGGRRQSLLSCNKGLTLIEIAVVMVLIGILVGLGATMVGPVTQRIKINSTKDSLAAGREAIIGYFISRRELPCGATGTCTTPDARFDTLAKATDGFNSPLYYIYSGDLRTDGTSNANVCGISSSFITLRVCHDTSCTTSTSINNVAFVLLSRGENINKQTNGNGSIAAATTISVYDPGIENVPDGDATDTDSAGTAINRAQRYDDLYTYVTLNELKAKAGCTRYETCATSGITIRNNGATVYYRRNNGTCTAWANDATVNLATTDSCQVFTDNICTTLYTTGTNSFSYAQLKDLDIDNDCSVQLNAGCLLVDR